MQQSTVTIGDIVSYGQSIMVFCRTCTHHKSMDPANLVPSKITPSATLADLEGAFQCTRCHSTNTGAELRQSVTGKNWR